MGQGFSFSAVVNGLKNVIAGLSVIGEVSKVCSGFSKRFLLDLLTVILDIVKLISTSDFRFTNLLSLLLNFYKLFSADDSFKAQSLDAMICSVATLFLPQKVFEFFKRITVFSNVKFLDDPSMFYDFLDSILGYIRCSITVVLGDNAISKPILDFLDVILDKVIYCKFRKLLKMADDLLKKPKLAIDLSFRNAFYLLRDELEANTQYLEWVKRSNTLAESRHVINRAVKILQSYDCAIRVEPSCFVFEGPPGTLKSVLMNGVIEALKEPCYMHAIKAVTDGKDWYDTYNNEPIFAMDDVGQQGISQWRTVINMVSPVKLPLDCAEASLKHTKFFSSEKMLMTTNKFMTLGGLSKSDCISEIGALWRRAVVIDFGEVKNIRGVPEGKIVIKYLNPLVVNHKSDGSDFIEGFPKDVLNYMEELKIDIPTSMRFKHHEPHVKPRIIAWLTDIVSIFSDVKKQQQIDNDYSKSDHIVQMYRVFKAQGDVNQEDFLFMNCIRSFSCDSSDEEFEDDIPILEEERPHITPYFQDDPVQEQHKASYLRIMLEYFQTSLGSCFELIQSTTFQNKLIFLAIGCVLCLIVIIIPLLFKKKPKEVSKFVYTGQGSNHPSVGFISKQMFEADVHFSDCCVKTYVLASGHYLVGVAHTCPEKDVYITVYKNRLNNSILLDHCKYEVVYKDSASDVIVYKSVLNMATPFKNLSKHFKDKVIGPNNQCYFIGAQVIPMHSIAINSAISAAYKFRIKGYEDFNNTFAATDFKYKIQGPGLCGNVVFDVNNGVLGMHVAGNEATGIGVAIAWSDEVRRILHSLLSDDEFILDLEISDKETKDFSGIKLDSKMYVSTPKNTNIIETPLYGIFPVSRFPAELSKFGKHTVKDVAKKSFVSVKDVNTEELKFASEVLNVIIDDFTDISEQEVVKGNEWLASLNKDSSNGYHCMKDKDKYINFEEGSFTPMFREEINVLLEEISNGKISIDNFIWCETLKDELRSVTKDGVPRSFRVSTIHVQVITKMLFGGMVSNIMKTRHFHGISIGINPFSEWGALYDNLVKCDGRIWASDISKFDGNMLPQVQTMVNEVILRKYKGKYPKVAKFILSMLVYCLVALNDDLFLTNHSLPSGSFLTALFNSFVNKSYKAMWFFRYSEIKTIVQFFTILVDYVYGDDTVNGTNKSEENLNAVTMRDFFISIGLDCTTSDKKSITKPYDDINDISFLKRTFRYHPGLGKIVCPLALETLFSSISWYDSTKDLDTVLQDKISCFQREIYLHHHLYEHCVDKLEMACFSRNIYFRKLPVEYIKYVYIYEPESWKSSAYSDAKYM
jgi:hypothetical protein